MNIKELEAAKDEGCSGRLSAIICHLCIGTTGSSLTHNQEPAAEIQLRPEVLGSVLNGFKPICWSGRHMSMLALNILTV